jgi:hypothetical protein
MNCSVCGAENEADARFCAECGAQLEPHLQQGLEATLAGRPGDDDFDNEATILSPRPEIEAQLRNLSIEPVEPDEISMPEDDMRSALEPEPPLMAANDDLPMAEPEDEPEVDHPPPPQAGDNSRKILIIVGLILAVLILCCCCLSLVVGGLIGSDPQLLDEFNNLGYGAPLSLSDWHLA